MADRFQSLYSENLFSFTAGERPTADKFNAMIAFFKRRTEELQYAVGDLRSQSWMYLLDSNGSPIDSHMNVSWGKIEILIASHQLGGVTTKCVNLAMAIDTI